MIEPITHAKQSTVACLAYLPGLSYSQTLLSSSLNGGYKSPNTNQDAHFSILTPPTHLQIHRTSHGPPHPRTVRERRSNLDASSKYITNQTRC